MNGCFARSFHHRGRGYFPEPATIVKMEDWVRRKE